MVYQLRSLTEPSVVRPKETREREPSLYSTHPEGTTVAKISQVASSHGDDSYAVALSVGSSLRQFVAIIPLCSQHFIFEVYSYVDSCLF